MRLRSTVLFWTVIVGQVLVVIASGVLFVGTCTPVSDLASVNVTNVVLVAVACVLIYTFYTNAQDSARRGRWVVAGVAMGLTFLALLVAVATNNGEPQCLTKGEVLNAVIDALLITGVLIWLRTKPIARR